MPSLLRSYFPVLLALAFTACATPSPGTGTGAAAGSPDVDPSEYKVNATLYMQTAAEYKALCYQAYNVARRMLDEDFKQHPKGGKRAVIVDIDETILDNSPQQGKLHQERKTYTSEAWYAWTDLGQAAAVPGSVDFLKYASARGARVFYVTSRKDSERPGTLKNLRRLGFPLPDEADLMTRSGPDTSKEARRQAIEKMGYRIVMTVGDNLGDHSADFDVKSVEGRAKAAERHRADFGTHYIVLPNPVYGDWESAIYGGWDPKQTDQERAEMRRKAIRSY